MNVKLGPWPTGSWSEAQENMKLGIIDFRRTPNFMSLQESSADRLYFLEFMTMLQRQSEPRITQLPMWLWICGTKEAEVQEFHYAHSGMFRDTYNRAYSSYLPSPNERLEDRPANNKLAKAKVYLIFIVKKSDKLNGKSIKVPVFFEAPNTSVYQKPCKYNELEYKIMTSELRMEFYLQILEMFYQPGDAIVSIFGGGKVVCAGVVSSPISLTSELYLTNFVFALSTLVCVMKPCTVYLDAS
jgi:hypothetical protein